MGFNDIILIDKEQGSTSFSVDSLVKRLFGTKKVGHSGTLDPFATGLLPVFVGDALRLIRYTDNYDKTYRTSCVLGMTTDTLDVEGEVVESDSPYLSNEMIDKLFFSDYAKIYDAINQVKENEYQIPPKYSAKKINGKKAYELARQGQEVTLKPNRIKIYDIEVHSIKQALASEVKPVDIDSCINSEKKVIIIDMTVHCSKGTYIRTLCNDIGKVLGTGGFALSLRRLKCGDFDVFDAITPEELKSLFSDGKSEINEEDLKRIKAFRSQQETVGYMPVLELNDVQYSMIKVGKKLKAKPFMHLILDNVPSTRYRAMYNGELAAIVYFDDENGGTIRIERMLVK